MYGPAPLNVTTTDDAVECVAPTQGESTAEPIVVATIDAPSSGPESLPTSTAPATASTGSVLGVESSAADGPSQSVLAENRAPVRLPDTGAHSTQRQPAGYVSILLSGAILAIGGTALLFRRPRT
jgi:hypothetical protein